MEERLEQGGGVLRLMSEIKTARVNSHELLSSQLHGLCSIPSQPRRLNSVLEEDQLDTNVNASGTSGYLFLDGAGGYAPNRRVEWQLKAGKGLRSV